MALAGRPRGFGSNPLIGSGRAGLEGLHNKNGFGRCKAKNGQLSRSQRKETECVMGTVLELSTTCSGTALSSPGFVDGLKLSMCLLTCYYLN